MHQDLSVAAQAAYSGLSVAAQRAELARTISSLPGGFAKKTVVNKEFWYYQCRMPDGKLSQQYVGPDDVATQALIAQHKDPIEKLAAQHLQRLARGAIEYGCASIEPSHARVLAKVADAGFFSAGMMLAGTHAFMAYQNLFGVRWTQAAATVDLDLLHYTTNISLALPENAEINALSTIDSLRMGFIPNAQGTSFRKADEPDFEIDFLTSRGRSGDDPVFVPRFNQIFQPLRFLELSIEDPMRLTLLSRQGPIVVNAPKPERYALNKLLIHGLRSGADASKGRKDTFQAAALMDYLLTHESTSLARLWEDVATRGPNWRKQLLAGFAHADQSFLKLNLNERLWAAIEEVDVDAQQPTNDQPSA